MRWVASLFALGLMMALFHRVTAGGALEARATLALGFLLLAAHVAGDIVRRARLPRLTGYLLVAFAVGPAWLGLVRRDEVDALRFVADAGLALIALAAGAELKLETLRRREGRVELARLTTGAIAVPFAAVTLVTLSVTPWLPLTVHQSLGDGVAVALVLGTVAAASSPAFTLAVMSELDARGPVARTLLGVAIAQDVVVVGLFALVLAVAKPLTSAGAVNLAAAGTALAGLAGSVVVGAALGVALERYLRLVRRETVLLLVAAAFLASEVARFLGLDILLIALATGFYLENFAPGAGERLRSALKPCIGPATVVFVAVTGAGVRLGVLADLWGWAVLFAGLRVVGLRYGCLWAGRVAEVTPVLAREGWWGLISQGGTVLALAGLARRAFPEWGVSLEALIVAMVGVHEIAGPICLRRALDRVRELTEEAYHAEAPVARGGVVAARGGVR